MDNIKNSMARMGIAKLKDQPQMISHIISLAENPTSRFLDPRPAHVQGYIEEDCSFVISKEEGILHGCALTYRVAPDVFELGTTFNTLPFSFPVYPLLLMLRLYTISKLSQKPTVRANVDYDNYGVALTLILNGFERVDLNAEGVLYHEQINKPNEKISHWYENRAIHGNSLYDVLTHVALYLDEIDGFKNGAK